MRKTSGHATVKTACVYVTPIFFKKLFSKMSRKVGQSTTFHIKWRGSTIFREGRFSLNPDDARVPSAYAGIRQSIFANRETAFRGVQLGGGRCKNIEFFINMCLYFYTCIACYHNPVAWGACPPRPRPRDVLPDPV